MIALILGTRPEIIKFAPIVWELQRREISFEIIHSGQHYSPNMDSDFFKELGLPEPRYHCEPDRSFWQYHGYQTSQMLWWLEDILIGNKPDIACVLGDTNTALAGCIAASKLKIPVAHIEAGLRSRERWMPEEQNRIMIDHNSDYWFPPTREAYINLIRENLEPITDYGNTIKNVVCKYKTAWHNSDVDNRFALVTIHRQENTDDPQRLRRIIGQLRKVALQKNWDIYFPIHPRTKKVLDAEGIDYSFVKELSPVPLKKMLELEAAANVIITDSGGVQEEACILGTPCITVRPSTERPETIRIGANRLTEPFRMSATVNYLKTQKWIDPYGDGHTAKKIVEELCPE